MAQARTGHHVRLNYTGKLDDGTVFATSAEAEPLESTLGTSTMPPAIEEAVEGMETGETKTVYVPEDEAFGPWREELVQEIPRDSLPEDIDLEIGEDESLSRSRPRVDLARPVRRILPISAFFAQHLVQMYVYHIVQLYKENDMPKRLPSLSASETEILRLLWGLHEATVQQVCEKLPAKRRISYATVQTLLRRLEKKGYINHRVEGKAHVFAPAVEQEHVIKRSVNDFLERLFGGDAIPLVQHLAEHGRIDAENLERLKKLVEGE